MSHLFELKLTNTGRGMRTMCLTKLAQPSLMQVEKVIKKTFIYMSTHSNKLEVLYLPSKNIVHDTTHSDISRSNIHKWIETGRVRMVRSGCRQKTKMKRVKKEIYFE